jgi:hypothetical protein
VDRLLGELLAREAEARAAEVRVEGDRLAQAQADAVSAFAVAFAPLFSELYQEYARDDGGFGLALRRQPSGIRGPSAVCA